MNGEAEYESGEGFKWEEVGSDGLASDSDSFGCWSDVTTELLYLLKHRVGVGKHLPVTEERMCLLRQGYKNGNQVPLI